MSRLSSKILSSSSSLRMMMSSSSSLVGELCMSSVCLIVLCVSFPLSDLSESESDSVSDDDDDDDSDSELLSSVSSDSDSSSSSSDSSVVGLSGFCGAFCNLFRVESGKIWSMFKRCRFSASSSSVNF